MNYLKFSILTKIEHVLSSRHIDGETVLTLFFGAPKFLQMVIAAVKLKDVCSLEGML